MAADLHPDILRACWRADIILWNAFSHTGDNARTVQPISHLVFPRDHDNHLRVSEQEARLAFVEALCQGPLHYSVETPTRKRYGFSGAGKQAAQTDLTVRDEEGDALCNVEFKHGGFSRDAQDHMPIAKDMEKLVREPIRGLWFHLLEGVNNSTIDQLLDVLSDKVQRHFDDIESPGLTIHLCVLRHRFSIHKHFPVLPPWKDDFAINLRVSRMKLLEIKESNGWVVGRPA